MSSGLQAVILDWAGTTVDYGSLAPVRVIQAVFQRRGIAVSDLEARRDMGIRKRDHLRAILRQPRVAAMWRECTGSATDEAAVDALYADFEPMQLTCLQEYARVIPGVSEAVQRMRARGMKIGSTTGYTRPMLDVLLRAAAEQGYEPDAAVTPDETGGRGRPDAAMALRAMALLGVSDSAACVKIGDTVSDMEEGRNAGMWTIGVTRTGNLFGMTEEQAAALPSAALRLREEMAAKTLFGAGAHYVAAGVAECDPLLEVIAVRMAAGERP